MVDVNTYLQIVSLNDVGRFLDCCACLRINWNSYKMIIYFLTASRRSARGGHINVQRYRDDLLEPIVRLYAGAVGENIIVMHDNARPHTTIRTSTRRV